jgi:hypothetical protein
MPPLDRFEVFVFARVKFCVRKADIFATCSFSNLQKANRKLPEIITMETKKNETELERTGYC